MTRLRKGITYVVVPKVMPGMRLEGCAGKEGDKSGSGRIMRYYACAKARNVISTDELISKVQVQYRIPDTMVREVLKSMAESAAALLADGYTVQLPGLGSLRLSIGSRPASSREEFHESMITRKTIVFRPSESIEMKLRNAQYVRMKPGN